MASIKASELFGEVEQLTINVAGQDFVFNLPEAIDTVDLSSGKLNQVRYLFNCLDQKKTNISYDEFRKIPQAYLFDWLEQLGEFTKEDREKKLGNSSRK